MSEFTKKQIEFAARMICAAMTAPPNDRYISAHRANAKRLLEWLDAEGYKITDENISDLNLNGAPGFDRQAQLQWRDMHDATPVCPEWRP